MMEQLLVLSGKVGTAIVKKGGPLCARDEGAEEGAEEGAGPVRSRFTNVARHKAKVKVKMILRRA